MQEGWRRVKSTDERGRMWIDHVSPDGQWMASEGWDEEARHEGKPWALLRREPRLKGGWRVVEVFATLAKAKRAAA